MTLSLDQLSPKDWSILSQTVHKYSFGVDRSPEMDRIDYALVVRKNEELMAYMTIVEIDAESAYMQHGGNFKEAEGTTLTFRAYLMMVNHARQKYKNVSTRIWNKNKPMLKLATAVGFTVTGVEMSKDGNLFLFLDLETNKECL